MSEFHSLGFYGDSVPDPGWRATPPVQGHYRRHVQAFAPKGLSSKEREREMSKFAARAILVFSAAEDQGHAIEWHTLEFKVDRAGTDPFDGETWRWSVWGTKPE